MSVSTKAHIRSSIRDAIFTNLNIGMVEGYFCAFMLALGVSEVIAGMGTVIPQFIGVVFQLFSIRDFFRRIGLKSRIVIFLSLQALMLMPLIFIGLLKYSSPFLIISILSLYWASLLSLTPPWNRLIGHTVPYKFRLKFFSIRNQFGQFSVFVGLITSGVLLYYARPIGMEVPTYVAIFSVGLILKLLSLYEVKFNHNDYDFGGKIEERLKLRVFIKRLKSTEQGKLVVFLFFFYLTVYFSAPFFNPYMLNQLKLNYIEYMAITAIAYFGRVFMFKILQKRAKSRQIQKILIFSCIGITTSPLWWSLNQNYWWIFFIEFLSGCYWAGFELSTILLYYQKIEDSERTSVMTYITFFNTTGMITGTLLGGWALRSIPDQYDKYLTLFAASTILRALVVLAAPQMDFKGRIPNLISFNRVFSVRPPYGALTRPILGRLKKKPEDKK